MRCADRSSAGWRARRAVHTASSARTACSTSAAGRSRTSPCSRPYAASYIGVDPVENARAELRGSVEALPVEDGSFDVVLCNQVLEHCDDPALAVRELRRVTAARGRVLASTHGVMPYHPSPTDYWRWTHAGLEKIFVDSAPWASVRVTPASGTTACVGMIVAMNLDLALRRLRAGRLSRPLVTTINRAAEAIDRRSSRLREPTQPGTLFANFHVVAEVAA